MNLRYLVQSKMPPSVQLEKVVLLRQACEYLGSLPVPLLKGVQKESYINDKLMGFSNVRFGLNVTLVITVHGIKTLRDDSVKLGHSISHVLFTSFLPLKYLFAYVTKSYSVEQVIQCQAHVYKLSRSKHYNQLNKAFENAFDYSKHRTEHDFESKHLTPETGRERMWLNEYDALDHFGESKEIVREMYINETKKFWKKKKKEESFDLSEYVVIEDKFIIENEYYNLDTMTTQNEPPHLQDELNIVNEYYNRSGIKVNVLDQTLPSKWLLPSQTSLEFIHDKLRGELVGSYLVVPHRRDCFYTLYLRVPVHINDTGLLSCIIKKEREKGFHLQGCLPYFKTLLDLVKYYGSIHERVASGDQVDHGIIGMVTDVYGRFVEDYEYYESIITVMQELDAYKECVDFNIMRP